PDVATVLNNISGILMQQGKYDEALALFNRCISLQEKAWGPVHVDIADSLNNIGLVQYAQGDYKKSLAALRRALVMYEQTLGKNHAKAAECQQNIGTTLQQFPDRMEESHAEIVRAQAIFIKARGKESRDVASCLESLAAWARDRHRLNDALALHRRSLA